jgi:hypothetical protein
MRTRARAAKTGVVVLAVAAIGWASPARSEVINQRHFTETTSEDVEFCGLSLHVVNEERVSANIRVGKGDLDTLFFGRWVEKSVATFTNSANGKFFTVSGNSVSHDIQGELVKGSIFRQTIIEAGLPVVLTDMNWNVVMRDRGVIRTTILFDTGGDHVPGGETVEVLDLRVSGPHPDFFLEDAERCALVQQLIG